MAMLNLTNQKFGKLTPLEATPERKNRSVVWKCRCDCGNIIFVSANKLTKGDVKSCGCLQKEKQDLAGRRFGKLIAVQFLRKQKNKSIWKCLCDCGKYCEVYASNLKSGHTTSCGCYRDEVRRKRMKDITDQRFGKLVALRPTSQRCGHSVVWLCQCDCGQMTMQSQNNLAIGRSISCGCYKQENNKLNFLKNIHFIEGTCLEKIAAKSLQKNNTSGIVGVSWDSKAEKWVASITFQGKKYYLGSYRDKEDAARARCDAEKMHDDFVARYRDLVHSPEEKSEEERE